MIVMLEITPIPAFSDNYIWMLKRPDSPRVALIDPGDEKAIMAYLQKHKLQAIAILITHQHYDHTGGVAALVKAFPGIEIICPNREPSEIALSIDLPIQDLITTPAEDGSQIQIEELDISFNVMSIPGHTLDHVAYYGEGAVFCGDTIFGCGCGFLFSGTAEQMAASMNKLAALPGQTRMYCAHEYTLDNIGFAKWVEPDNPAILQRDKIEMEKQLKGLPTMPSTIELELKTNPFMRFKEPVVIQAAEKYAGHKLNTDGEVFAAIREWKNKQYDA